MLLRAHSKQFVWENVNNRTLVDFIHFIALMLGLGALHAGQKFVFYFDRAKIFPHSEIHTISRIWRKMCFLSLILSFGGKEPSHMGQESLLFNVLKDNFS